MPASTTERLKTNKILARRAVSPGSRHLRSIVQLAFLLLNVAIGVQFYRFVRQFEISGSPYSISRPPAVEGWLPIAGLMNLKSFLATGRVPALHPAAMFLLIAFLAISLVCRKAFCSWLCPAGTVSEWLWKLGRRLFRRNFGLPRGLDIGLRGLKYLLLGFFLYVVATMSVAGIHAFLDSPYGIVADVKMLNLFRDLSLTSAIVLGVLVVASVLVQNFWCRYLCPYGALMGLVSMLSPMRIRRDRGLCIDCGKCAKACPSRLPVDRLVTVRSAECLGCMECVNVCPAEAALDLTLLVPRRRVMPSWAIAVAIAVLFFGVVGYAQWSGHWASHISIQVYRDLIPNAARFAHP
jgi:polyferredoxin